MEPLEFLGGKYQQTEQILPGAIQTFRAQETASGRPVFVHRISSNDEPLREAALLRLLSAALLRSSKARKMVLDVTEAEGFSYVVTQTAPQCLLLREWLQCEVDDPSTDGEEQGKQQSRMARTEAPTEVKAVLEPAKPKPPDPALASPSSGEFTQRFRAMPGPQAEPAKDVPPKSGPTTPEQGGPETASSVGEFTQYFREPLPASRKRPTRPESRTGVDRPSSTEARQNQERPSKTGFVQRPNTPLPGEFTRLFSTTNNDPGAAKSRPENLPEVGRREPDSQNLFDAGPNASGLPRPASPEPSEYTRIFGSGNAVPGLQKPSSETWQINDNTEGPLRTAFSDRAGTNDYTASQSAPSAAPPAKTPSPPPVPESSPPTAAGNPKTKLIILFLVLGVLAIALIVLVILIALKK